MQREGEREKGERLARIRDTGGKLIGNYLRARYFQKKREENIIFLGYTVFEQIVLTRFSFSDITSIISRLV